MILLLPRQSSIKHYQPFQGWMHGFAGRRSQRNCRAYTGAGTLLPGEGMMMARTFKHLETKAVHAGVPSPRIGGAVIMPIFQSAMFEFTGEGSYHDLKYLRLNNTPTQTALHEKLAALETRRGGCCDLQRDGGDFDNAPDSARPWRSPACAGLLVRRHS